MYSLAICPFTTPASSSSSGRAYARYTAISYPTR
jgi:hypothetical protein